MEKEKILAELLEGYRKSHPKSESLYSQSCKYLIKGGSHNIRLFSPFPFMDASAKGSTVTDVDGNTYVDFWQGHYTNILGHNPEVLTKAMAEMFSGGQGLITGFPGLYQAKLAELLLSRINAEVIRFTTSGTLATMYAVMLAKAFTGREKVMKVGGGWHGAHPFLLKGVSTYKDGFNAVESDGVSEQIGAQTIVCEFNDLDDLEQKFKEHGDSSACFILELMVGAGGFIFAQSAYVDKLQELSARHGVLLIIDEVVTGFRFHAGGLHVLYGITPDICVFGKTVGGGMPISAVAGKKEILSQCGKHGPDVKGVKFDGGTFSAHPAAMRSGHTLLSHLIENESEIYPRIGRLGAKVRREMEKVFARYDFNVKCTGDGGKIAPNSSVVGINFLKERIDEVTTSAQTWNPALSDIEMRESIFKLAMIQEGFYTFHGYGAISSAHTEAEIQGSIDAAERIAKHWRS